MEVLGTIKEIGQIQIVNPTFRKRDIVVTTNEQYPQHLLIEFQQEKCDTINTYNIGDIVNIGLNLKGREWVNAQGERKYFNTLQGWRIKKQNVNYAQPVNQFAQPSSNYTATPQNNAFGQPQQMPNYNFIDQQTNSQKFEDDVPF